MQVDATIQQLRRQKDVLDRLQSCADEGCMDEDVLNGLIDQAKEVELIHQLVRWAGHRVAQVSFGLTISLGVSECVPLAQESGDCEEITEGSRAPQSKGTT